MRIRQETFGYYRMHVSELFKSSKKIYENPILHEIQKQI